MRTLVWFRGKDLRLSDHVPLTTALAAGEVLPLFVIDPYFFAPERARDTPHRVQFLLESIAALARELEQHGTRLLLAAGKSHEVVPALARRWRVDRVTAQAWAWPVGRERDRRVRDALEVPFELTDGETLLPPGSLRTTSGSPYSVFTPFARAFRRQRLGPPLPAPAALPPLPGEIDADPLGRAPLPELGALGLTHNPALPSGGEPAALQRLGLFVAGPARRYHTLRDQLGAEGTSRLSQDLKFGTLSVRQLWSRLRGLPAQARAAFENELVWRDFAYSTLWDRPELLKEPFRPKFEGFPWRGDEAGWRAWAQGTTGYPVVDAAARQLLAEGFVHKRARMLAASFLTKHLLVDYKRGEAHYMRYLTDGDDASNNAGWQWSAGSGSDAQPYFRIFNPLTQGKKFDPLGAYVRRWVPELARLEPEHIHAPWQAPTAALAAAGVRLGTDYPRPIVELSHGRERFLATAREHFGA